MRFDKPATTNPIDQGRVIGRPTPRIDESPVGRVEPLFSVPAANGAWDELYVDLERDSTVADVQRAIGAPRGLEDDALNAFLDRVGRTVGAHDAYSALAEQARTAKTPGDLIKVAAALYRWNQEMTRGRQ